MKVQLLGWSSKGLRCPDFNIILTDKKDRAYKVALIQMPNGTGKTTTLTCLRAALTGEAEAWSHERIQEFRPREGKEEFGEFEVRLRYDDRPLTLGLRLDFENGKVHYATTFDRGRQEKRQLPTVLLRFLRKEVVRLLIFDGELPQALLRPTETEAEAAIDAFFQLYLLGEVRDAVEEIWERRTSGKTAKQDKGYTRRLGEKQNCEQKVADLTKAQRLLRSSVEAATIDLEKLRAEIDDRVGQTGDLRRRQGELDAQIVRADTDLKELLQVLMNRIRAPHLLHQRFGYSLSGLKDQLDRLKLPESSSRQFFEELAHEDTCVCGRPLDDATKEIIRQRASLYLGSEKSGIVNALKSDIARHPLADTSTGEDAARSTLDQLSRNVIEATHERDALEAQKKAITQQLIDGGDKQLQELQERFDKLEAQRKNNQALLDEIEREPMNDNEQTSRCLKWWKGRLDDAKEKLAEITETLELHRQSEIIKQVLEKARQLAMGGLKRKIVSDMNQSLDRILKGHSIVVREIDKCLVLGGQKGASQGQQLAVGYAFLTTLFQYGQHAFPFVVDAPVTALDTRVSSEIGQILPRVCPQFVAFVLDREREGFADALATAAKNDVLYITAFENSARNANLVKMLPKKDVVRTANGVLVMGKDYFDNVTLPQ